MPLPDIPQTIQFSPSGRFMAFLTCASKGHALYVQDLHSGINDICLAGMLCLPKPDAFVWQKNGSICRIYMTGPATLCIGFFEKQMPLLWGQQARAREQSVLLPGDEIQQIQLSVAPSAAFCIAAACSGVMLIGQASYTMFVIDLQLNHVQAAHVLPGLVQQCE